jgi:hypothetical protein
MKTLDFKPIEKEAISALNFSRTEMLTDPEARKLRTERLTRACQLGNGYKGKVLIQFVSLEGAHEVNTTVWNCSEEMIVLKQGVHIPVSAITFVSL